MANKNNESMKKKQIIRMMIITMLILMTLGALEFGKRHDKLAGKYMLSVSLVFNDLEQALSTFKESSQPLAINDLQQAVVKFDRELNDIDNSELYGDLNQATFVAVNDNWRKTKNNIRVILDSKSEYIQFHKEINNLVEKNNYLQSEYKQMIDFLLENHFSSDKVSLIQRQSWIADRISLRLLWLAKPSSFSSEVLNAFKQESMLFVNNANPLLMAILEEIALESERAADLLKMLNQSIETFTLAMRNVEIKSEKLIEKNFHLAVQGKSISVLDLSMKHFLSGFSQIEVVKQTLFDEWVARVLFLLALSMLVMSVIYIKAFRVSGSDKPKLYGYEDVLKAITSLDETNLFKMIGSLEERYQLPAPGPRDYGEKFDEQHTEIEKRDQYITELEQNLQQSKRMIEEKTFEFGDKENEFKIQLLSLREEISNQQNEEQDSEKCIQLEAQITRMQGKEEALLLEIASLRSAFEQSENEHIANINKEKEKYKISLEKEVEEAQLMRANIDNLEDKIKYLRVDHDQELSTTREQDLAVQEKLNVAKGEIDALTSQLSSSQESYTALEQSSSDQKQSLTSTIDRLEESIKHLRVDHDQELSTTREQDLAVQEELNVAKDEIDALTSQLSSSQESYTALEQSSSDQSKITEKYILNQNSFNENVNHLNVILCDFLDGYIVHNNSFSSSQWSPVSEKLNVLAVNIENLVKILRLSSTHISNVLEDNALIKNEEKIHTLAEKFQNLYDNFHQLEVNPETQNLYNVSTVTQLSSDFKQELSTLSDNTLLLTTKIKQLEHLASKMKVIASRFTLSK
jgi:hypothetical protein